MVGSTGTNQKISFQDPRQGVSTENENQGQQRVLFDPWDAAWAAPQQDLPLGFGRIQFNFLLNV